MNSLKHKRLLEKIATIARKTLEKVFQEIDSSKIAAVYLAGSVVRGDFILGVSDIDFFIIYHAKANEAVWEEESFQKIKQALDAELIQLSENKLYREIDICTLTTGEITHAAINPENFSFVGPRKYLGIYSFDFVLNTKLLMGEDILQKMVIHKPQQFVSARFASLRSSIESVLGDSLQTKKERDYRLLLLLGELVRLLCITAGVKSLHKEQILNCFREQVFDFPQKAKIIMILESYSQGIPYQEVLKQFTSFEEFITVAVEQINEGCSRIYTKQFE